MKRFLAILTAIIFCFALSACDGVKLDEGEVIENNGTEKVVRGKETYTTDKEGNVYKNGEKIASFENSLDNNVFVLGEYVYKNTSDGAMQASIEKGKVKKFGSGQICAAKGKWIYYKSDDNKANVMTMYKIDMIEGGFYWLFEDETIKIEEIQNNVFLMTTKSGKKYISELNDTGKALEYEDWKKTSGYEEPTE